MTWQLLLRDLKELAPKSPTVRLHSAAAMELLSKGDGRKARQLLLLRVSDRKEYQRRKEEQLLLRVSDRKE